MPSIKHFSFETIETDPNDICSCPLPEWEDLRHESPEAVLYQCVLENETMVKFYGVEWYKVLHTSKPAPGFLFVMVWCMLCNEPMVHVFKVAD